jgi:hypothetical protein
MWIFSIPSAFQRSSLSIGPGFGQRPACDTRVDEPEGEFPFVPHFHFVWVLSGPLTISLEAAAQARVVVAWVSQIYLSIGCSAPHIKQLTVDLVILRSPLGVESISSGFGPSDPVSTSKADGVVASRMLRL